MVEKSEEMVMGKNQRALGKQNRHFSLAERQTTISTTEGNMGEIPANAAQGLRGRQATSRPERLAQRCRKEELDREPFKLLGKAESVAVVNSNIKCHAFKQLLVGKEERKVTMSLW